MNVLVVGSGAREHALVWELLESSSVKRLYYLPGNDGTAHFARNLDGKVDDVSGSVAITKAERAELRGAGHERCWRVPSPGQVLAVTAIGHHARRPV